MDLLYLFRTPHILARITSELEIRDIVALSETCKDVHKCREGMHRAKFREKLQYSDAIKHYFLKEHECGATFHALGRNMICVTSPVTLRTYCRHCDRNDKHCGRCIEDMYANVATCDICECRYGICENCDLEIDHRPRRILYSCNNCHREGCYTHFVDGQCDDCRPKRARFA